MSRVREAIKKEMRNSRSVVSEIRVFWHQQSAALEGRLRAKEMELDSMQDDIDKLN